MLLYIAVWAYVVITSYSIHYTKLYDGLTVGELTNVLGFIIQNDMTINDLLVAQIGTQPMLTASPAGYPLIKAAEAVAKQL